MVQWNSIISSLKSLFPGIAKMSIFKKNIYKRFGAHFYWTIGRFSATPQHDSCFAVQWPPFFWTPLDSSLDTLWEFLTFPHKLSQSTVSRHKITLQVATIQRVITPIRVKLTHLIITNFSDLIFSRLDLSRWRAVRIEGTRCGYKQQCNNKIFHKYSFLREKGLMRPESLIDFWLFYVSNPDAGPRLWNLGFNRLTLVNRLTFHGGKDCVVWFNLPTVWGHVNEWILGLWQRRFGFSHVLSTACDH